MLLNLLVLFLQLFSYRGVLYSLVKNCLPLLKAIDRVEATVGVHAKKALVHEAVDD